MTARIATRLAAALLVVTAGLFAIGVRLERGDRHSESTEATHTEGSEGGHEGEGGERSAGQEWHILGLDPESPGPVTVAVAVSLALAGGLWFTGKRGLALTATAFAVLFAVLDVAEVGHQLDEARDGLAALAAAIAIGHGVAALAAGRAALRPDTTVEVP
jgi:hypothetical protein